MIQTFSRTRRGLLVTLLAFACGGSETAVAPPVGIGPEGGTYSFLNGLVTISIPPDAVTTSLVLTVAAVPSAAPSPLLVGSTAVTVSPDIDFDVAVTVTIRIPSSGLPQGVNPNELRFVRLVGNTWQVLPNAVYDAGTQTITASVVSTGTFGLLAVSAGQVTITPSGTSVAVNATTTLSTSIMSIDGVTLPDRVVSWSSLDPSIATVTQAGVVGGVAAGGPARIVAAVETVSDTAHVDVTGGNPPPPPPPSNAWLEETFESYSSIAVFISDPRGIYTTEDEITPQWSFVTPGYGTYTRALRYTYPNRTGSGARCTDYTIQRNMSFPTGVDEVWVEFAVRFSADFTTRAPSTWSCNSNPDFKFIFIRTNPGARYSWKNDIYGTGNQWDPTVPGQGDGDNAYSGNVLHDGQWHVYRMHARNSTSASSADGRFRGMIDGTTRFDLNNVNTVSGGSAISEMYGLKLFGNLNQGPDHDMELDVGYIRIYNTDPGWAW